MVEKAGRTGGPDDAETDGRSRIRPIRVTDF